MDIDDDPEEAGRDPDAQWARVAADVRAYREAQRARWGDVDDVALSRFVAGSATEEERERVLRAMLTHPELTECIETVREVLSGGRLERGVVDTGSSQPQRLVGTARFVFEQFRTLREVSRPLVGRAPSPSRDIITQPKQQPSWTRARPDGPAPWSRGRPRLIDALVIVAMIGVALAIMMPVMQSAREAARRAQCVNDLKQISLACYNYESAYGSFPMGNKGYAFHPSRQSSTPCSEYIGHSTFVFILPYLEGGNVFNAFNLILPYYSASNVTAISTNVTSYICTSDTDAAGSSGHIIPAQASYGASRGLQETIIFNWANKIPPDATGKYFSTCNQGGGDGMFGTESQVRISSVTDGTSNTFFFGEMSRFKNEPSGSGFYFNYITASWGGPPWSSQTPFWPNDLRITGGAYQVPRLNAPPDTDGSVLSNCLGAATHPPDWVIVPACQSLGQFGFRSLHPGGSNFAFADGSVKFIKDSINLETYRALGTRAGGEVISADSY
jgi:prepilin-type processing-associated H-X9-DG protein